MVPVDASRFADFDIALFRSFYERSGLRVARLDRRLRIAAANGEFQRDFGGSRRDLRGVSLTEILHPDYREPVERQLAVLLDQPGGRYVEQVAMRAEGQVVTGRLTAFVVPYLPDCTDLLDGVLVLAELDHHGPGDAVGHRRQLLSEVDARILEGICAGVSTMQLAAALFLSRGGVEYHVKSLMQRFKVKNRSALISKVYAAGIFRIGQWPPRVPQNLVK
ncbi:LuxR C-terminal-related transcriptional regulator [Streptomyces sp. NBC_01506]|uniref:helix-turn-helix transcriptional regulator n=1 Tax=Streptomyces sp. NBC_01506 TaxID=2903887 RepID=UPI0038709C22